jgi:hypothetical protein
LLKEQSNPSNPEEMTITMMANSEFFVNSNATNKDVIDQQINDPTKID